MKGDVMIEEQEELDALVQRFRAHSDLVCAIDTEADSLHRYRESLCLIQFAAEEVCVLIDPLKIPDLQAFGELLGESVVWMHGADYDMTMLKRQFGVLPPVVLDTQIGARLLGLRRFGLGDLVHHYFGVELEKSSQKADWGRRPLSAKMMEYALNDVHYLIPMGARIVEELMKLGRYEWFEESCQAAQARVMGRVEDAAEEGWRVQGSGRLDRRGLAVLRAMWHWRNGEAEKIDKPTFMVVNNRTLLEWANLEMNGETIVMPRHFRDERQRSFEAALQGARELAEEDCPEKIRVERRKRPEGFDEALQRLLKIRDAKALALDIEGSLIASRATLESIAGGDVAARDVLLNWQCECLEIS